MKKLTMIGACLALSAAAVAQNLNPTVEVTNVYAREATGIDKPSQLMALPDSVFHFNLDFDYSVRSTPYRGAYEFAPYRIQLRPQPRPSTEGNLYVKAGAGFTLHPELSVVWTPLKKDILRLNLYADHASYVGRFKGISSTNSRLGDNGSRYGGFQTRSLVGADALLAWTGGHFSADLSYKNIGASLSENDRAFHNFFQAKARIGSHPGAGFVYDAGTHVSLMGGLLQETHTRSDARIGMNFGLHRIGIGADLETVSRSGNGSAGHAAFTPHYVFDWGRFNMDLGVKIAFLFRSDPAFYPHKGGVVFPDVRVSVTLLQDALTAYASATGGNRFQVYSDLLESNPFLPAFSNPAGGGMDNSVERVDAALGLRGNIAERFHYDLKGGFAWWQNAMLYGFLWNSPVVGYADNLNKFYVDASFGWKADYLDLDARILLQRPRPSYHEDNRYLNYLFRPASFSGQLKALYKWGERFRGGVILDARSASASVSDTLPGYFDLGLYAGFQLTARLGVWLRGGNLLGQTIQYVPGYAQQGPWVSAGVIFTR